MGLFLFYNVCVQVQIIFLIYCINNISFLLVYSPSLHFFIFLSSISSSLFFSILRSPSTSSTSVSLSTLPSSCSRLYPLQQRKREFLLSDKDHLFAGKHRLACSHSSLPSPILRPGISYFIFGADWLNRGEG